MKSHESMINTNINEMTEEQQIFEMWLGRSIKEITNPSEVVQLAAIGYYLYQFSQIENPTEAVKLRAVQRDGYMLRYIKNPSEELK